MGDKTSVTVSQETLKKIHRLRGYYRYQGETDIDIDGTINKTVTKKLDTLNKQTHGG